MRSPLLLFIILINTFFLATAQDDGKLLQWWECRVRGRSRHEVDVTRHRTARPAPWYRSTSRMGRTQPWGRPFRIGPCERLRWVLTMQVPSDSLRGSASSVPDLGGGRIRVGHAGKRRTPDGQSTQCGLAAACRGVQKSEGVLLLAGLYNRLGQIDRPLSAPEPVIGLGQRSARLIRDPADPVQPRPGCLWRNG